MIPRSADAGPWPLSFAQERLWFLDRLEPANPLYNICRATRLLGELDVAAIETALCALITRHESLRTRFVTIDGAPFQVIDPAAGLSINRVAIAADALDAAIRDEARRPFDLVRGLPIRATLFRIGPLDHVLLFSLSHIVFDGWSFDILYRELKQLYVGARRSEAANLGALPIRYVDYAQWQRQYLTGDKLVRELSYWTQRLAGMPARLELPADRPRPAVQTHRGKREPIALPSSLSAALKTLATKQRASLFMVLLTALEALLSRYTGETDICIGAPAANRTRVETEGLIGFFVNTLVMRTDLSGDPSFRDLLRRVWETTVDAYDHQDLPFEKLVEALQPRRSLAYTPLFQVMFAWQSSGAESFDLPGLTCRGLDTGTETSKFDLTLFLEDAGPAIQGSIEYNTDIFDSTTIRRLAAHYTTLLESAVADPERRLSQLRLLTEAESRTLLVDWNDTCAEYHSDECIHTLFEAQAARTPSAIAVQYGDERLTYGELNSRANRVANWLLRQGVKPGGFVGVSMERSPEMIARMLGVLKAGAAYVPLDPMYPQPRLSFMIEDSGVTLVLTGAEGDAINAEGDAAPPPAGAGESLAYVIYTSGSTGQPKGVPVPHRAVNRLVVNTNYIRPSSDDAIAQLSNCSFDAATFEIWGALLNGARVVGLRQEVILSPHDLRAEIEGSGITVMFLTTALFNQVARIEPATFRGLRTVLFGGEASDPSCVAEILRHDPPERLLHVYGPTEATTFASWHLVTDVPPGAVTIPIGRPISNTRLYVLDRYMNPVPAGVAGELYIGGPGLAHGYLNRPELTAERFVADIFSGDPRVRLYKTGDRVRYLPTGDIEFLGRFDDQVKIRGWRIEPGEIETALAEHSGVARAVVSVREETPGDKRLVAYVVSRDGHNPTPADLRRFVLEKLPAYMAPSAIMIVDKIPLNANGKIDRAALPAPIMELDRDESYLGPRDPLQYQLVRIWEELLGADHIGVRDNFFDLGGHSLLAVRMVDAVEKVCGKRLPLAALFANATIERIADALLRQQEREPWTPLIEIQRGDPSRPPFVFLHGDFVTGGFYCLELARALGPDQPFYALQPHGLDGAEAPFSIEEMAEDHLRTLRNFQPDGPYFLGGHCNGGVIAFEMARRLREENRQVGLLVLVHGWAGRAYTGFKKEWPPVIWERTEEELNSPNYYLRRGQAYSRYTRALWVYSPQFYPGEVTLFWPAEEPFKHGDMTGGWSKVAASVEVHSVPGDHLTSITTHVADLAAGLRASLNRAYSRDWL